MFNTGKDVTLIGLHAKCVSIRGPIVMPYILVKTYLQKLALFILFLENPACTLKRLSRHRTHALKVVPTQKENSFIRSYIRPNNNLL